MLDVVEDKQGFARLLATLDVPAFSIRNPTCVGKIRRREPLAVDDFEFLRRHTDRPIKVTLPGPYLLTRAMWVKEVSRAFYPTKEDLGEDVVRVLREEVRRVEGGRRRVHPAGRAGADRAGVHARQHADVHVRRAGRAQRPRRGARVRRLADQPCRGTASRCVPDGRLIGLHVCRGNWSQDETTLLRGSYHPLTSYFAQMHVDQLVLEYATPRAGDFVPVDGKSIGLGVVNPRDPRIESAQAIVDRVATGYSSTSRRTGCF